MSRNQNFIKECEDQKITDLLNGLFTMLTLNERKRILSLPVNERAKAITESANNKSNLAGDLELLMTLVVRKLYTGHFLSHTLLGTAVLALYLNGEVGAITSTCMFFGVKLSIDKAMKPLRQIYLQNVNFYGHTSQGYILSAANTLYDFIPRMLFRGVERNTLLTEDDKTTIELMMPNFGN